MRFLMLAETCTLGISFHFRLESLCRKTRPSCARVLWIGLESCDQCFSESLCGVAVRWGRIVIVFFGVLWACHVEPACRFVYV